MKKIAVIGQGYVGLPLALEFSNFHPVYGYDINSERVNELNNGNDHTLEADSETINRALKRASETNFEKGYKATSDINEIIFCKRIRSYF